MWMLPLNTIWHAHLLHMVKAGKRDVARNPVDHQSPRSSVLLAIGSKLDPVILYQYLTELI